MKTNSNSAGSAGRKPPQFGIGSLVFVVVLVVVFFMLGQSMVRHRFFRGGWMTRNGVLRP
jgi:hypothetical protein